MVENISKLFWRKLLIMRSLSVLLLIVSCFFYILNVSANPSKYDKAGVLEKKHEEVRSLIEKLENRAGRVEKKLDSAEQKIIKKEEEPKVIVPIENNDVKFGQPIIQIKRDPINYTGELTFRAKKSSLWIMDSKLAEGKKLNDFIEVNIPGELYAPYREIKDISKSEVDRKTIESAISSIFSANKNGDLDWIVGNFIEEEQKKARFFFQDKNVLKDSQDDAKNIIAKHIVGRVDYNNHVIIFVEQNYGNNKKITEAITLKNVKGEYKLTNALAEDETYDLIFAAISNGEVFPKKEVSLKG